jgi:ribosomal protein L11 methyltransferase
MISNAIQSNPFYQPPHQWQIRVFIKQHLTEAIEEAFEDIALSLASFEIDEDNGDWGVDILTELAPESLDIPARLALISGILGINTPQYTTQPLNPKDWVSEVERSFPPLCVGRFYVHGSHVATLPPASKIALHVNAGAAFGSGEHATTSGCLLALDMLAKKRHFLRPLDMGCGSGILAIAMAKLWHCKVIGSDIDPVSIHVAKENAKRNKVAQWMQFSAGNGYRSPFVMQNHPFDIIVANILARPLMKMAADLRKKLAPRGIVVLSGLLASQERMILAAHRMQGLKLLFRIRKNGWNTLVLYNNKS